MMLCDFPMLPMPDVSVTFAERVFAKIDASGDCWEWTGSRNRRGYGIVGRQGPIGAPIKIGAHRAVYELLVGPIPPDMHFDHLCRNTSCVNPDHGEIVTPDENKRRGYSPRALNAAKTHCDKGHEFTQENTCIRLREGHKSRRCRACNRERVARVKARQRAQLQQPYRVSPRELNRMGVV